MTTLSTSFQGKAIINVLSVSKEFNSKGHWTIKAEFQTADGKWHKISVVTTHSRIIDKWNDAIADDDVAEIMACEREALCTILNQNDTN